MSDLRGPSGREESLTRPPRTPTASSVSATHGDWYAPLSEDITHRFMLRSGFRPSASTIASPAAGRSACAGPRRTTARSSRRSPTRCGLLSQRQARSRATTMEVSSSRTLSQTTSRLRTLSRDRPFIRQPEGNGCIEQSIRTLKAQLLWLHRFRMTRGACTTTTGGRSARGAR